MFALIPKTLKLALFWCFLLASCLVLASYYYSREALFIWFNGDLGKLSDHIFSFISYLGEGWMWIPYFVLCFGWYKKDALFILLNFLISTLLTQIPKNFIWENLSRPMASNIPKDQIHLVSGVEIHLWNSFPSGHTATAFTLYLVTVYFFPNKWVLWLGGVYALTCGYARVYLGQHFPLDVGGGIWVSLCTILLSIYIRKNEKTFTKFN